MLWGAVAELSKALLLRKEINENLKIPGWHPSLGNLFNCSIMNSSSGALSTIKLGGTRGGGGRIAYLLPDPAGKK